MSRSFYPLFFWGIVIGFTDLIFIFRFNRTSLGFPCLGLIIGSCGLDLIKDCSQEHYRVKVNLIIICIYVNSIILGYGLIVFIFYMYLSIDFIFLRLVFLIFLIIILIVLSLHSILILSKRKLQKEIKYGRFRDPISIPKEEIDRIQISIAEVEVDLQKINNRLKVIHSISDTDKVKQSAYELKKELNKQGEKLYSLERNFKKLPLYSFVDLKKEHYKQEKKFIKLVKDLRKYLSLKNKIFLY